MLPGSQHFGGKGACWSSRMRLGRMTSNQSFTWTCTNQTTSWLVHSWSTFGVRTNHRQIWTHKTHHGLDLGEATTFPLIVYFVPGHETSTQMSFCPGTSKWKSWNSNNWDSRNFGGPITFLIDLWLRWGLQQSCSPCRELSNGMLHATYT
jgi:hypothetical protein